MGCGGSKISPGVLDTTSATPTNTTSNKANTSSSKNEAPSLPPNQKAASPVSSGLPPLAPPRKTKAEVIPHPRILKAVDEFVAKLPKSSARSVEELAKALTKNYRDDLRQARALFSWLAFNIRYDIDGYFSGLLGPQDSSTVLQTGTAVCEGYSDLFEALCKVINLPCVSVSGIAKGYGYDPEDVLTENTESDHAWNLVLIQGEWRPLDSTWGAGYGDDSGQYVQRFDDHWFLTDPAEFILQHFPLMNSNLKESEKYQLLKKPMTIAEYSAHVQLESAAQVIGLKCLTHEQTVIDVVREVTIKIKAERLPLVSMKVTMTNRGSPWAVCTSADVLAWLDDDGMCTVYVRPSRAVTYLLEIYGKAKGQYDTELPLLLKHVIRCKQAEPNVEPFPDINMLGLTYSGATECGLRLIGKDSSILPADKPFLYKAINGEVTVPTYFTKSVTLASQVYHACAMNKELKNFTFIKYVKNGAKIFVRLPRKGYYNLRLFSSNPKAQRGIFHHAADLLLLSDTDSSYCMPFPQSDFNAFKEMFSCCLY